jgi:hypothetical protein
MADKLHLQLQLELARLELFDTHAAQAMRSIGLAIMEEIRPPPLLPVEADRPQGAGGSGGPPARYYTFAAKRHAHSLREMIADPTRSAGEVVKTLRDRRKEMRKFAEKDVFKDLSRLLTGTTKPRKAPARQPAGEGHLHTALRALELADTHLAQAMSSLMLALPEASGHLEAPGVRPFEVEYPASPAGPYTVWLSGRHAEWVDGLLQKLSGETLTTDDVLGALTARLSAVAEYVAGDVLHDFHLLLTNDLKDPFPPEGLAGHPRPARGAPAVPGHNPSFYAHVGGGDPPPVGCCTLPNGSRQPNLTQSMCLAYGTGSSWQNTGGPCP